MDLWKEGSITIEISKKNYKNIERRYALHLKNVKSNTYLCVWN